MNYEQKLKEQLRNFSLEKAMKLSDELHQAEAEGEELSNRAESYWLRLTTKIESSRSA
jgi:hypothetical protein